MLMPLEVCSKYWMQRDPCQIVDNYFTLLSISASSWSHPCSTHVVVNGLVMLLLLPMGIVWSPVTDHRFSQLYHQNLCCLQLTLFVVLCLARVQVSGPRIEINVTLQTIDLFAHLHMGYLRISSYIYIKRTRSSRPEPEPCNFTLHLHEWPKYACMSLCLTYIYRYTYSCGPKMVCFIASSL